LLDYVLDIEFELSIIESCAIQSLETTGKRAQCRI